MGVMPAMLVLNQIIDDLGNDDHFIGIFHCPFFAKAQHLFGHPAPFLPIVIRAVMGKDDAFSQQTQQRHHQPGANGVNVNHVGAVE